MFKFNPFTGSLDYYETGSSGTGDVVGPASSTDSAIALYDGTTGKLIKDSATTITTSVGSPGVDTKIPTEKAVRSAISTAGGGDVSGPSSSVDNRITRFDGITGKLIQSSTITLDDTNVIAGTGVHGISIDSGYGGAGTAIKSNGTTVMLSIDSSEPNFPLGLKSNSVEVATTNDLSSKADDSAVVHVTGNESIAGIKTFSSFPISPSSAPTTDYQVTNKKYVDDSITAAGGYTDENAQDAVGNILTDSSEIDFTYNDATPSITAVLKSGSIDESKLDTSTNASLDLADNSIQKTTNVTTVNDTAIADGEIAVFNLTSKDIRTSGKTIVTTLGADDTTLPTSKAVKDVTDTKITGFADPNADRIVFWDDSAGAYAALTPSTGLTVSTTSMTVRSATTSQTGIAETATDAEVLAGTDTSRYVTPSGLKNSHTDQTTSIHGVTGSVVGTSDTQTLTGKTVDADSNTISNLEVDNLKTGVLDIDLSSVSTSDDTIPSAKATKTYVDATKFTWKGAWATSTSYSVNDSVQYNGSGYICVTAHTSGTFSTDLAAEKWSLFVEGVSGNSEQIDCSDGTSDTYGALSGLVNSSNTVYTVSLGSYISGSLMVYLNGQLQTQGTNEEWVEDTPASGTFDMNIAPQTGDVLLVTYQYTSGATGNADTLDGVHASGFATTNTSQTFTNKTIDADDNTITNIGSTEVVADLISGQSALTTMDDADSFLIYDFSASALKEITSAYYKIDILKAVYPVGSLYHNDGVSTNPATLFGFGTWSAFGAGRVVVGIDATDTDFDTSGETGGEKTHTLTSTEMPSHTHTQDAHTHTQDAHTHTQNAHGHATYGGSGTGGASYRVHDYVSTTNSATGGDSFVPTGNTTATNQNTTATNQNTTATNQNTGGGGAHNNVQPYVVSYRWKRTA